MAYWNLKAEIKRHDLFQRDIARILGIRIATANGKINGKYSFTLEEAFKIQKALLPDCDMQYLFQKKTRSQRNYKNV